MIISSCCDVITYRATKKYEMVGSCYEFLNITPLT